MLYIFRQGLWRLGDLPARPSLQASANRDRNLVTELILLQNGECVLKRGRIGGGRSRGDDVERIADNVRNDQAPERLAAERLRESAALDARQVLADGVHLVDGRAAGVQQFRHPLLVVERESFCRGRQQG